jgi:predicted nucleic acid-binding protein
MKLFADTNWLLAMYLPQSGASDIVERFHRRYGEPVTIAPPVFFETRNALARISRRSTSEAAQRFCEDIGARIMLESNWSSIEPRAHAFVDRYSHKGVAGSFDLFILAAALECGASHFLCFDSGSNLRALAALEKLQIVPALTTGDKQRMAQFR